MSAFYKPGAVVHQEKPFVQMIYRHESENFCDYCFKGAPDALRAAEFKIKFCVDCKYVGYCRKKCQKLAWKLHKHECRHLAKLPQERRDFIRLIGLVLFAVEGKDWNSIRESVGGVRRSFQDLVSNCHITKNDRRLSLHGLEMARLVKEYLEEANKCDDDQLIEIIGKRNTSLFMSCNAAGIITFGKCTLNVYQSTESPARVKHNRYGVLGKGSALYIGASIFEHSCIPSAVRSFAGTQMTVRANCEFTINSIENITISYTKMVDLENRFAETKKTFYGPCMCWDCSLPYGDSPLTSILDRTRAFSVIECTELALDKLGAFWKNGGTELDDEKARTLKKLLKMQENVLGNTNILRMKLLLAKAHYEKDLNTKKNDLIKLQEFIEDAFGSYSEELLFIYQDLSTTFLTLANYEVCSYFAARMGHLEEILYGTDEGDMGL